MKNPDDYDNDLVDWVDALENQILFNGKEDTKSLLTDFISYAKNKGLVDEVITQMPFENSISQYEEFDYPGDWIIEEKMSSLNISAIS